MKQALEYRIRWERVLRGEHICRMCIAEARVPFLWTSIWITVANGGWRTNEDQANRDIIVDRDLRRPLPPIKVRTL